MDDGPSEDLLVETDGVNGFAGLSSGSLSRFQGSYKALAMGKGAYSV